MTKRATAGLALLLAVLTADNAAELLAGTADALDLAALAFGVLGLNALTAAMIERRR